MRSILSLFLLLAACGQQKLQPVQQQPLPTPTPTPTQTPDPGTVISYQEMQGYLVNYCQACHAGAQFMSSESALNASQAKNYLLSRRMPPANAPKVLPDNVRTKMLGFFG